MKQKNISTLPANLPDIPNAKLPQAYEHAKQALEACATADEAWTWQDKAAALAAYGRMARDQELINFALKVQANAIYRAGELLRQIPPDKGGRPSETQDGAVPSFTRTQAANDAGLSERQRKTALRVASIPHDEFSALVESDSPPTMTELAMRGTVQRPRPAVAVIPVDPTTASRAVSLLRDLASFCAVNDAAAVGHAMGDTDLARGLAEAIGPWLDRFVTSLP